MNKVPAHLSLTQPVMTKVATISFGRGGGLELSVLDLCSDDLSLILLGC